jgi:hypothetical protein
MITASNTRNIISQDDLIIREKDNFPRERIEQTLKALIESKLVLREPRRNVYFYEIVSEFLVPWIKQQQAARLAFLERRKLEQEAAKKLALANRQKRKLFYTALVIVLFLLLGIIAIYLLKQNAESRRALEEAANKALKLRIERDDALKVTNVLSGLNEPSPFDRLAALEAADALLDDRRVPPQIIVAILSIAAADKDPTVAARADQLIKEASTSSKELAQSLSDLAKSDVELAESLPPRFYIHLANDNQIPRYERLRAALEKEGYVVASYENVGEDAISSNQLRYFHRADQQKAEEIVESLLRTTDPVQWVTHYIRGFENSKRIQPGHFEIWIVSDNPKNGTLILTVSDQQGKEIPGPGFKVTLVNVKSGERIEKASGYIAAPPGVYAMTVSAPGHEESRGEVTISAGGADKRNIILSKK